MAFDPERFGDAIKTAIDRRFELLMAKVDARLARLEGAAGVASPAPDTSTKAMTSAAMFSPDRAYARDDTATTSDGQLWRALRYTKGMRHPRNSPSWERVL